MSKRYKADATTIRGRIEALQAATEGRLFSGEHPAFNRPVDVEFNASSFGVYIDWKITKDQFGWFSDHDLWIEPKESDNE